MISKPEMICEKRGEEKKYRVRVLQTLRERNKIENQVQIKKHSQFRFKIDIHTSLQRRSNHMAKDVECNHIEDIPDIGS
jgi:hypothetical protein